MDDSQEGAEEPPSLGRRGEVKQDLLPVHSSFLSHFCWGRRYLADLSTQHDVVRRCLNQNLERLVLHLTVPLTCYATWSLSLGLIFLVISQIYIATAVCHL